MSSLLRLRQYCSIKRCDIWFSSGKNSEFIVDTQQYIKQSMMTMVTTRRHLTAWTERHCGGY